MSVRISDSCTGCTACTKVCPVGAITGERKHQHVVDSSKCIECGACGRVCPVSAVFDDTDMAIARLMPQTAWAKPVFDLSQCISCAACEEKCPTGCISLSKGRPGGLDAYPYLSAPEKCVSCGYCAFYCPMECIQIVAPQVEGVGL